MELNQIQVFLRVVQTGSFSAAARQLSTPKSTISRRISELEQQVGARLLQRTTRKLGLTDAGRIFHEHAVRIVAEVEEASHAIGRTQAAPRGLLRVTAPLSFGMLGPIVAEYLRAYPDVEVEMVCTDRRVDLVEERFDVAVRAGRLADSSLVARPLGAMKRVVVAAPGYCKEHGTPRTPADLAKHAGIVFGAGATPVDVWSLESGGKHAEVRVKPRLAVNDFEIMRAAALGGVGIALIAEFVCAEDVRRGRLRHVIPAWCSAETPVHALYPTARHLSPKVAAFVELVRERLQLRL
jgi:DNA-binding transcriptional LysR family regulator